MYLNILKNTKKIYVISILIVIVFGVFLYTSWGSKQNHSLSEILALNVPEISDTVDKDYFDNVISKVEDYIKLAESYNFSDQHFVNLLNVAKNALNESKAIGNTENGIVKARMAAIYAKTALIYVQAELKIVNKVMIKNERENLKNIYIELKDRLNLMSSGSTNNTQQLRECVGVLASIEHELSNIDDLLSQTLKLENASMFASLRIAYIAGELEDMNLSLKYVEFLMKNNASNLACSINVNRAYNRLYIIVRNSTKLFISYPNTSLGNLTLKEAKGYIERAEKNYNSGYKVAAFINLLVSYALLNALNEISNVSDPWYSNVKVTLADVFDAKRNAVQALSEILRVENVSPLMLKILLSYAYSDLLFADKTLKRSLESGYLSDESLRIGYSLYTRAGLYIKSLEKILNELKII
ncbi:MAG: hypothetical protein ACP5GU_04370 [Thermoprotei archaeon]